MDHSYSHNQFVQQIQRCVGFLVALYLLMPFSNLTAILNTARQQSCEKVMFLHLFVHKGGLISLPVWSHVLSGDVVLRGRRSLGDTRRNNRRPLSTRRPQQKAIFNHRGHNRKPLSTSRPVPEGHFSRRSPS